MQVIRPHLIRDDPGTGTVVFWCGRTSPTQPPAELPEDTVVRPGLCPDCRGAYAFATGTEPTSSHTGQLPRSAGATVPSRPLTRRELDRFLHDLTVQMKNTRSAMGHG